MEDTLRQVEEMHPDSLTVHALAIKRAARYGQEGRKQDLHSEISQMIMSAADCAKRIGLQPYYLYRQKYMSGALENVGSAKPGTENLYNIIMMEELQTVVSVGGGGVTKLVDYAAGRIVRLPNPKYPHDYLTSLKKVLAQKEELIRFYGSELP